MAVSWLYNGKPDVGMIGNGALAGLVAITAPCGWVDAWAAVIIGLVGGGLVVVGVTVIDKVLKVDGPVGAIAVHGVVGIWGTLAVGLFASTTLGTDGGVFTGNGGQFVSQLIATVATWAYAFIVTWILFKLVDVVMKVRVSEADEAIGLDASQHGEQEGGAV